MATLVKTLRDSLGNTIAPRTFSNAITMKSGSNLDILLGVLDVDITQNKTKIDGHVLDKVNGKEVHGLRVVANKLEYFDGTAWKVIENQDGLTTKLNTKMDKSKITISNLAADVSAMQEGDIWIKYEV